MDISPRTVLSASLRDFRRCWPQLLVTDLLARGLAVAVLVPLVGLLLRLFLATTATGVVADQAIVSFLLHPAGLAALVVVGAVSLGILFVETGQLMVIAFGAIEDRRVTWLDALLHTFRRAVGLFRLAVFAVVRLLLIALPCLAAVGAVYWLLLTRFDINYYLTAKPPEFVAAVVVSGLLLAAMALVTISKIAGWLLSVPMVLFEEMGGRRALGASESATSGKRRTLTVWIVGWLAATALLSMTVTFVVASISDVLVPLASSNAEFCLPMRKRRLPA